MENKRVATTAERLAAAMKDTDKKQVDLARETGLDRAAINRYVNGRYDPKWDAISKLARALNVSETWLWGYDVPKERSNKNDNLVHIISKLRKNESFYKLVDELSQLDTEHYDSIHQLLAVFARK